MDYAGVSGGRDLKSLSGVSEINEEIDGVRMFLAHVSRGAFDAMRL